MAGKQSVINLAWNLDTSNFDKARYMTDNLKNSFEGLKNPLDGVNGAVNRMHDQLGSIKDGYRGISDVAKSVYNNNRGINDTLNVMHDGNRKTIADYQAMNSKITDLSNNYKSVDESASKLTVSTQKSVIATQQLRQSLIDMQHFSPNVTPRINTEKMKNEARSMPKLHVFGGVTAGTIAGNALYGALSRITGGFKTALGAGMQYDQEQQKMNATWTTLTGNADKAQGMVNTVNDLSVKTGQAADTVDELEQGFYHLNSNKTESDNMTKSMLNMSDAVGLTVPKIQAVTQDMVNGLSRGKANGGMLNQISQYFPMFREQLAKYETQIHHGQKVTVADLTSMTKHGEISAKDIENVFEQLGNGKYDKAADNMLQTMVGMQRTIKARVPALIGAFEKPIMEAKNPLYGSISKWVSDSNTQKEFNKMGQATSKGISTITDAFAKAYNMKNGTKALDSAVTHITDGITKFSDTIAKNAPQIKNFFSMTKDTGVLSFKLFAETMKDVAKVTLPFLEFAVKHEKTVVPMLAGMFVANKALKFAGAIRSVASAFRTMTSAEVANSKVNGIQNLFSNGTMTGRTLKLPTNQASERSFASNEGLGSNLLGSNLGEFKSTAKPGMFNAERTVASSGRFSRFSNVISKIGESKLGGAVVNSGLAQKATGVLPKIADVAKNSKLLTGVRGIASKIPYLDVAMAGTQLIGMNHKNAGGKIGSAGGMLAGTAGGAALGSAILPGIGTVIGGAVGGIAGTSLGKKIGNVIQSHIPKHLFSDIGKQWHGVTNMVAHSSFGKSIGKTFDSVKNSASRAFKPVARSWHSLTTSLSKDWQPIHKELSNFGSWIGKQFAPVVKVTKPVFNWLGKTLKNYLPSTLNFFGKVFGSTFSGLGKIVSTSFKVVGSVLSGAFRSIKGVFEVFSGIFTGNWKKTWSGVKDIFGGVWDAISNTFKDVFSGIIHSVGNFFGKVGHFIAHPIQSIKNGLHLATGTHSRYPNGLRKDTHAILNDGNGPEIVRYPNGKMVKPIGANVHMMLPKGSHVYNSGDTSKIMNLRPAVHFASGTGFEAKNSRITSIVHVKFNGLNMKSALITTRKYTSQVIGLIKRSYSGINRSSSTALRKMVVQSSTLWKSNNRNMQKELTVMSKQTSDVWKNIDRDTSRQQKVISTTADKFSKALTKSLTSGANDLNKQLNGIWNSITSDFKDIFAKLGPYAHSGMNGAVDQLNNGISGIDKTLSQFGGNSSVLQPIHYAQGTDAVDRTHLAMVNDAKSGFQNEAILSPNGGVRYANGRNALTVLHKGESVLNGADTQTAISKGYIPRHASGVGSKKALRALAKRNASDFTNAFNTEFTDKVSLTGSDLQKGIINSGRAGSANDSNGYNWSHAMWSVIHNAMSSVGASATGLLKAVEKYGTGHKYVWGATGPDAFDCSGLVQYALKQMGIEYPRTSGEQISKAQHISRAQAEPGDLIGNAEHIGVVADKGAHHYFSAFNPSSHPNILMTPVNGSYFPGTPQFGRVGGISKEKSKGSGIKGVSSRMQSLVKSQLGSKALSWIGKSLGTSISASGNPAGDGVQRWRPDVIKALGSLHLSTSDAMVDRVLRQINTESSGNPSAMGGTDGLSDGRAMGLMQVKPGTFKAYGNPSLGGWNNGMASIYAGLNYAKHRYGPSLSFLGNGHGYAKGGRPPLHKPVLVGEEGPEIAEFDSPVKIHPHNESKRIASGFGKHVSVNPKITININGSASKNDAEYISKKVYNKMMKAMQDIFTDAQIEQAFNHG